MTAAMLIALLLQSGVCSQTQFEGPAGLTLTVVVCPVLVPPGGEAPAEESEPEALPPGKRQKT